jgi:hypothetical protein
MFLGAIVSLQEDRAKKHKVLVLCAFGLLGIGGFIAGTIEASSAATASAQLSASVNSLKRSSEEQARVSQLNTQLQEKLVHQSDTITELAKRNIGEATGGDSFCYLIFTPMAGSRFLLTAIPKGKFPLRTVTASIGDVEKFKKATIGKSNTFDTIFHPSVPYETYITIEDLPRESQHAGRTLQEYDADDSSNYQAFNISFLALNGAWTQLVRMKRVDGKWTQATRVMTRTSSDINKDKVLFERVYPGYPDKSGQIDWLR